MLTGLTPQSAHDFYFQEQSFRKIVSESICVSENVCISIHLNGHLVGFVIAVKLCPHPILLSL